MLNLMCEIITAEYVRSKLGERPADSHKGKNGRGLVIAGSGGMPGAAVMCAAAALRAGIGTLRVLTAADRDAFYNLPEAMTQCVSGWDGCPNSALIEAINDVTCAAVGPGMGTDEHVLDAVLAVISSKKPAVVDADGLNALARTDGARMLHENIVVTPHIGEMSRLTGLSTAEVAADMASCARRFAAMWGCTVLLKSDRSVAAAPDGRLMRNENGNAGLAKGGSGDVLCGITLAMLGQGLAPFEAACAASYILGASADEAFKLLGLRVLMARDVIDVIQNTVDGHIFKNEEDTTC